METRPRPTADTAYEALSSDGYFLFPSDEGGYVIWARQQAMPTGTEEETP